MSERIPLTSLSFEEAKKRLIALGESPYRATQIFEWVYQKGVQDFSEMTNLSAPLREELEDHFAIFHPKVERFTSSDGTLKFRMDLADENAIEMVWIPENDRHTLCVSSQVGCPLDCKFCVTGAIGFKRNLTVDEIVDQVRVVKSVEKLPVSNVVFMGMGEPLLNTEAVIKAIKILTAPEGLAVGKRKITVSTAGIIPQIISFFEATDIKLAISLTGATDSSRNAWMPINRKYDLAALTGELRKLRLQKGRRLTFEVVLMEGKNDSEEEAEHLGALLRGIPAKVNLIPYNQNPFFPKLRKPEKEKVRQFRAILTEHGIETMVRKNRGEDILAACGQLAGKEERTESRKAEE